MFVIDEKDVSAVWPPHTAHTAAVLRVTCPSVPSCSGAVDDATARTFCGLSESPPPLSAGAIQAVKDAAWRYSPSLYFSAVEDTFPMDVRT